MWYQESAGNMGGPVSALQPSLPVLTKARMQALADKKTADLKIPQSQFLSRYSNF